jgi:O-antigen/teichoic acid export membrane protein
LNPIKKLASQTAVYGLSSILGRFLNYLLVPIYTYSLKTGQYGVISEFYAYTGFLGVVLVLGFETGYFRFSQDESQKEKVYTTALNFVTLFNLFFAGLIVIFVTPLANALHYADHHEYFYWFAAILAFDAISNMPFARLRAENKAVHFAGIKIAEIAITIFLNIFFIIFCKSAYEHNPDSALGKLYNPQIGVGYVFISNLVASFLKWLMLLPQMKEIGRGLDRKLLIKMFNYSFPMVIIGFAGIINEMLDRAILKFYLPYDIATNMQQLGIYGACYKLSLLMTLFIQAFRYAAEPFFFAHARENNSKEIYAEVMKYFIIVCAGIFLLVMLYLDLFKYFIGKDFRVGLKVVPILLLANLCLGAYVNLSIWYKLTDKTWMGAIVSIIGAVITVVLNVIFIPEYGYMASAWATLACYGSMALISYILGQKYYPVNYNVDKIGAYILFAMALWLINSSINWLVPVAQHFWWLTATLLMGIYLMVFWMMDGKRLRGLVVT